jgi:hypothetical protein
MRLGVRGQGLWAAARLRRFLAPSPLAARILPPSWGSVLKHKVRHIHFVGIGGADRAVSSACRQRREVRAAASEAGRRCVAPHEERVGEA